MKKIVLLLLLLLALSLSAQAGMNSKGGGQASGPQVTSMTKGDYGPMEARDIEKKTSSTNVELEIADDIWVPVVTDQVAIKAEGRTRFGFKWTAQGTPSDGQVEFIYRVTKPDGQQMHAPMMHSLGQEHDIYYWCQQPGCVPGLYVLEVESPQGQVLSQEFNMQ